MLMWLYICTSLCFGCSPKRSHQRIVHFHRNLSSDCVWCQLFTPHYTRPNQVIQSSTSKLSTFSEASGGTDLRTNRQPHCGKQTILRYTQAQRAGQLVHIQLRTLSSLELSDLFSWTPLVLKATINKITQSNLHCVYRADMGGWNERDRKSCMFTFHIVVNLSSGHDVMKSGLTLLREDDFSRLTVTTVNLLDSRTRWVGSVSLFHFIKASITRTHRSSGARRLSTWAEPKHWGKSESSSGVLSDLYLWYVLNVGVRDNRLGSGRAEETWREREGEGDRHDGHTGSWASLQTEVKHSMANTSRGSFWPCGEKFKTFEGGEFKLPNQFKAQMLQFILLLAGTQSDEKTSPLSCLYSLNEAPYPA